MTRYNQDFSFYKGESKIVRFNTTGIDDIDNITDIKFEATDIDDREVNEIEKFLDNGISVSSGSNDVVYIDVKINATDIEGLEEDILIHEVKVMEEVSGEEFITVVAKGQMKVRKSIIS